MGDFIQTGDNSSITNRSTIQNSFNQNMGLDSETRAALIKVGKLLDATGSAEARELMEDFVTEAKKSRPKKALLRSIFNGVLEAAPHVAEMTDAVEKIGSMFQ